MRLDALLLADAASAHDGKLYIHGGGITRIQAPAIPWLQPQLAIVARFEADAEDLKPGHALALYAPDGEAVLGPAALELPQQEPTLVDETEERYVQVVLTVGPVPFAVEGPFRLELGMDGEPVRSLTLPVVLVSARSEDPVSP